MGAVEAVEPAQPAQPTADEVMNMPRNPFVDYYFESIQSVRGVIRGQWRQCSWDNTNLSIEAHATIN